MYLVVVDVEVVWRRENGDEGGESGGLALAVHAVARVLGLVRADDGEEVVLLQEVAAGSVTERTVFSVLRSAFNNAGSVLIHGKPNHAIKFVQLVGLRKNFRNR